MKDSLLRQEIIKMLVNAPNEKRRNVIIRIIQMRMKYNEESGRFELDFDKFKSESECFLKNPEETSGTIGNTKVHWEIDSQKLMVWLEQKR